MLPCRSLLTALLLLLCAAPALAGWERDEAPIMGTRVGVVAYHEDAARARAAIAAVLSDMRRIDALMSPFKPDSELSRVNREAAERPVPVSEELFELVAESLRWSERTGGAFDITFASVGYLYDYRRAQAPGDQALQQALPGVNYRLLKLDPNTRSIRFEREGMRIDLGGIAKGHAVERGAAILRQHGIEHGEVNAGGDTRLLGDRGGRPWIIGVRDPRDENKLVAKIPLVNEAISTSGDYERYFERDGVRHHHIINPRTGRSAEGVQSASIMGPNGVWTDALSTSVFVLGVERGLALIDSLEGYEAVVVDGAGQLHFSQGLRQGR